MTSHLAVGLCMFAVGFLVGYVLMPGVDEPSTLAPRSTESASAQSDDFAASVRSDRPASKPATAAQSRRMKARIKKLEKELAQARPADTTDGAGETGSRRVPGETAFVGSDDEGADPAEIDDADKPEPFPEALPPRLAEDQLKGNFSTAFAEVEGASFSHVDCSEYPCVVYGELKSGSAIKHLRGVDALSDYGEDLLRIDRKMVGEGADRRLRVGISVTPKKKLTPRPRSKLLKRVRRRTNQEFGVGPKPEPAD